MATPVDWSKILKKPVPTEPAKPLPVAKARSPHPALPTKAELERYLSLSKRKD